MEIHAFIKQQHDEARTMMHEITECTDRSARVAMLDKLEKFMVLHAKTEEATYYEAIKDIKEIESKANHSKEEHETIEDVFAQLNEVAPDQDKFLILFGEAKMMLVHHLHEEEDKLFPKTENLFDASDAERLGIEMAAMQEQYLRDGVSLTAQPHPSQESRI